MTRCGACDAPTPLTVECGGPTCTLPVGQCCLGLSGLCPECEVDEARAAEREQRRRLTDADLLIGILLSHAIIGGQRMLSLGDAVRS